MSPVVVAITIVAALGIVLVATHLRPLALDEVATLSAKRRRRRIRSYFSFSRTVWQVDKPFKRRMNPNGRFYPLNESLSNSPNALAALLKHKKHEWIIVAFEREQRVFLMWLNKGMDKKSVGLAIPFDQVIAKASELGCASVLILHNHPNSNPGRYDCTRASQTDLETAHIWGRELATAGLNLVEFICERGMAYRYFESISDSFLPVSSFVKALEEENGRSRLGNLGLHWERFAGG